MKRFCLACEGTNMDKDDKMIDPEKCTILCIPFVCGCKYFMAVHYDKTKPVLMRVRGQCGLTLMY